MRRTMLITRLRATVQSFTWSDRAKNMSKSAIEAAEMNDERIEGEKEVLLRSIVTLDRAPPNRNRHSQGGGEEGRKERGLHRSSLLGEVKNKIFCLHPAVIGRSTSMGPICFRDR